MAATLRQLLIQRAARLQGRPALTAAGWGTLDYARLRNRVEGMALGLLAGPLPAGTAVRFEGTGPWAWVAELAAACCGLAWEDSGRALDPEAAGGARFNSEEGRGPYHDRDEAVDPGRAFHRGLSQGEVLRRLARLNARLGWDHETELTLPPGAGAQAEGRAALWSALYAGAHAILDAEPARARGRLEGGSSSVAFDPVPFAGFWDPGRG